MPFSTAGMNCRGIEPPKISSTNSKSVPRGSGSTLILQSPNCPWPPVCFLWRPCASVDGLDRLAVGDARRLQVDVDSEPPFQLGDRHFDVQLPLSGEQQLLGLRIAAVADRRVFFLQPVHRRADLVFVAAALRLDGVRQNRLREFQRCGTPPDPILSPSVSFVRVSFSFATAPRSPARSSGTLRLCLSLKQHDSGPAAPRCHASCCARWSPI